MLNRLFVSIVGLCELHTAQKLLLDLTGNLCDTFNPLEPEFKFRTRLFKKNGIHIAKMTIITKENRVSQTIPLRKPTHIA